MGKKSAGRAIKISSKKVPWVDFENEVANHIEEMVGRGKSFANSTISRVRRKPSYFSRTRNSEITFDIAVEISPDENFVSLEVLWLIECKHYKSRKVKVDEVEEFHDKMIQVGAHKGTIFTRVGFDSGAVEVARTHRIGLATLNKEDRFTMLLSASGGMFWNEEIRCKNCLMDDGKTEISDLHALLSYELNRFKILLSPPHHNRRRITQEELTRCLGW